MLDFLLKPLFFKYFLHKVLDLPSSSFDDEFSDNNLVVDFGSFFII